MNVLNQFWKTFEKQPKICKIISIIGLCLITIIAFLYDLGNTGLVDETEPLFSEASRQILVRNDWITPYFDDQTRFDKPILIYWLVAICYKIIGVNEWSARLPSALSGVLLTIMIFLTLKQFGYSSPRIYEDNNQTLIQRQLWLSAWLGSAITALNLETILWARQGVSDMLLCGCIGISLLSFFWGYAQGNYPENKTTWSKFLPNKGYLGFYVFSALAVLTKGPVGIVLPGLIILAFLAYTGQLKAVLKESKIVMGMIIFSLIAVPWFALVIIANGDNFINSFFGYHNLERFTQVVNGHAAPWYFYFLVVLGGFIPWSAYIPLSMIRLRFWKRNLWMTKPRETHLSLFALFWFLGIFVFFTIAVTKLPSYVLPLMPAGSILVGLYASDLLVNNTKSMSKGRWITIGFHLFLLLVLTVLSFIMGRLIGYDPAIPNLAEKVTESSIPFQLGLVWSTVLVTTVILVIKSSWRRWVIPANIIGFIAFVIFFMYPTYHLLDDLRQQPLRELALSLPQMKQPQEEVWMLGFKKPSVVFYSHLSVKYLGGEQQIKDYLQTKPGLKDSTVLLISREVDRKGVNIPIKNEEKLLSKGVYNLSRINF